MNWTEIPRMVIFSAGFLSGVVFAVTSLLVFAYLAMQADGPQ